MSNLMEVGDCRPQDSDTSLPRSISFLLYHSIVISFGFLCLLTNEVIITPIQAQTASSAVLGVETTPAPTPTLEPTPSPLSLPSESPTAAPPNPLEERESIRAYIRTIFVKNADTAYAISLAEGKAKDLYQGQVVYNVKAIRHTNAELSIGIFQINLKSKEVLVHYHRIPGATLEEKVTWLQNPYNNVLYAYWVYDHSGFHPWSVYSDGKYLAYMQ